MPLTKAELDRTAEILQQPHPGYPATHNRLFLGAAGLEYVDDVVWVPAGPWGISGHPNRIGRNPADLDLDVPEFAPTTPLDKQILWRNDGLLLDQFGRPIHPYWQQLMRDPRIGLPTGLGFFWRYGPNATADAVVYRWQNGRLQFLLILRGVGRKWAFPGGFLDAQDQRPGYSLEETLQAAALRETGEEAGLAVAGQSEVILRLRPVGQRDTLHAWTDNAVVLVHGDQDYLRETQPICGDDAIGVGWFTCAQIAEMDIFDHHRAYLQYAVEQLCTSPLTVI